MAKVMEVNGDDLATLLGMRSGPKHEASAEEQAQAAAQSYAECVRHAAQGCTSVGHAALHEHVKGVVTNLYRAQVMPVRYRQAMIDAWVSLKLHRGEVEQDGVKAALDHVAFSEAMLLVGAVALALGVGPEQEAPGAAVEAISGGSGDDERKADLRAGYL